MRNLPVYSHPPGELSKRAVLDVGLKCVHSCNFCYYSFLDKSDSQFSGMRSAKFRKYEDLVKIIDGFNDFEAFDVTGGEPTLHPRIVDLIKYASDTGKRTRIITLGQFLLSESSFFKSKDGYLIQRLIDAGLTNFLFSVHGHSEDLFKSITGESLAKQIRAWDYLDSLGFEFSTNTTVVESNYRFLPDIAKLVSKHGTYMHNFILMNAYYEWNKDGKAFGKQASFSEARGFIDEAIHILEGNGIAVNVRYMPLCTAPSKNLVGVVGVRYDPYEWMNAETHSEEYNVGQSSASWKIDKGHAQDYFKSYLFSSAQDIDGLEVFAGRGQGYEKAFVKKCADCANLVQCDGVDPKYLRSKGDGELSAQSLSSDLAPPMVDSRARYAPAFSVKNDQFAKVKKFNEKFWRAKRNTQSVSVVVTNYNYGDFVECAIESVLAQTVKCDVVVVDDNSSDGSYEFLVDRYPGLKIVRTEGLGQPSKSRNYGRKFASGEALVFLDADDSFHPRYIEDSLQLLVEFPIVYSDLIGTKSGNIKASEYNFGKLIYGNQLNYCSVMRSEVFDAIGGFRHNVNGCEDWDFWIAAGLLGFFGKRIPFPHLRYREKEDGLFQSHVVKNFDSIFRQIILNNREAYPLRLLRKVLDESQHSSDEVARSGV